MEMTDFDPFDGDLMQEVCSTIKEFQMTAVSADDVDRRRAKLTSIQDRVRDYVGSCYKELRELKDMLKTLTNIEMLNTPEELAMEADMRNE